MRSIVKYVQTARDTMKLIAFTRYGRLGASSRMRLFQFEEKMSGMGIETTIYPLIDDLALKQSYEGHTYGILRIAGDYLRRLGKILRVNRYELVWIQGELFPWLPPVAEIVLSMLNIKYVVDYDDAIFHRYDMHKSPIVRFFLAKKIDVVMKRAALVVAGNQYIADKAISVGALNVEIYPTVVDTKKYCHGKRENNGDIVVGWIGSAATKMYLERILPVLRGIANQRPLKLILIGVNTIDSSGLDVEYIEWNEDTEARYISAFDIGIMPLIDGPWERGKCGYKLIQYMASGIPVVATPVGVNVELVENGVNGYLAETDDEWWEAINRLCESQEVRDQMGKRGRKLVEKKYCRDMVGPKIINTLKKVA